MKHIPRKRFGQHFLSDGGIIDAIVDEIHPEAGQPMVEIGPGLAALTQPLVERLGHLTVVELDRDLAVRLRLHPHLTVVESDVLKVDFTALAQQMLAGKPMSKIRVVGNLPYNISSPILFHLLSHVAVIEDQHFMLQWRYAMENVLFVPPESFDPPPRVDSAVVRMVPHAAPPNLNVKTLETLVQVAFSQRRKMLRNTLGKWLDEKGFGGQFDLQRRAEEVPVQEYVDLVQAL